MNTGYGVNEHRNGVIRNLIYYIDLESCLGSKSGLRIFLSCLVQKLGWKEVDFHTQTHTAFESKILRPRRGCMGLTKIGERLGLAGTFNNQPSLLFIRQIPTFWWNPGSKPRIRYFEITDPDPEFGTFRDNLATPFSNLQVPKLVGQASRA